MAKIKLTPGRIDSLTCTSGQAFLWDAAVPGLGVRSTPGGKHAYIVQSRFASKPLRITIANVGSITLEDARNEARRLLLLVEQGVDPREQKRQIVAEQEKARAARDREDSEQQVKGRLVAEVWAEYLAERKCHWSERHHRDHLTLTQPGGTPVKRGKGVLQPGPLSSLMHITLSELTTARIESWLAKQITDRPAMARLSLALLKAFLNWCSVHDAYSTVVGAGLITRRTATALPKKQAKSDCLQKEQLAGWFAAVRQIGNPVIAGYLQTLLLTGARREELAGLRWEDVDFRWKSITIHDKVEGERVIPLTPFVEQILQWLPRRNAWVFSSPTAASGRIQEPRIAHNKALVVAGVEGLTIHGLRRSFGSLAEWCEMPVGIVAQIMGHKPSATAERHYRVRPLDLLRMWHIKFESWILEQAEINILAREAQARTLSVAV